MNPFPLIGLTGRRDLNNPHLMLRKAYLEAILRAGGVPVILPWVPEERIASLCDRLDGLVLTGGEDVNPLLYGQEPDPALGTVDTGRDAFELALTRHWLKLERPLLGICRGLQVLQVAVGGTLVQDLASLWPGAIRHGNKGPRGNPVHEITLQPGTLLAKLTGVEGTLAVNSIHHQAVEQVGAGYRVAAQAGDGVIEAVEAEDGRPVLAVQWHPEELEDAAAARLFAGFIALAREQRTPARSFSLPLQ
ncbi:MAG TPA: gamma-glutamyl-gamma-aminobutyrate hydrolase family protein [Chthoniobacteraceae bacterium]|nr:gamma-glutamyl-gamma-aminobutyrate hydrolase family protein [Chthoniobacteraceae bacterium]